MISIVTASPPPAEREPFRGDTALVLFGLRGLEVTAPVKNIAQYAAIHIVYGFGVLRRSLAASAGARGSDGMGAGPEKPGLTLTLVKGSRTGGDERNLGSRVSEIDWSILMARGQSGDSEAYIRLLTEISPYVRTLAARRGLDASEIEDALQDVLLTVHAIRQTYDPMRPFGPWLTAIADRRLVDRLRRTGRRRARESPLMPEHETFPDGAANIDEEISGQRALRAAVEKLPERQRQAIKLLKIREMSLKEAAMVSGMSIAALKVATHRALGSLRKMLSDRGQTRDRDS